MPLFGMNSGIIVSFHFSLNKPSFLEKLLKIFTWNLSSDCIETCILEMVLSPQDSSELQQQ